MDRRYDLCYDGKEKIIVGMEERMAKTILCYGDSNTYGYNPVDGSRYPLEIRWPGRLQDLLGGEYRIIEEGCNGRTTIYDDPLEGWKNGLTYLRPCLNSHKPLDYMIMMLGSNDLKSSFQASAQEIAAGAERLVEEVYSFMQEKDCPVPQIILVSPPEIGTEIVNGPFGSCFSEEAIHRSREFPKYYQQIARRQNCMYLDAAEYIKPSAVDSLHLEPEAHAALAAALAKMIRQRETE